MSMEEKQNSQTSLDFNQNIFKPTSREEIVEIVKNCYRKNIPLEINGLTATTSNTVAGAITEVSDNTIAFSIALG